MEKVTYSSELKEQLQLVAKATQELTKEDTGKSLEQFLAEISFIQYLLDELKEKSPAANDQR
jgi:hypothetical protein